MNQKTKGSNFERIISKELSLKLSNNQTKFICWRTDSSGARFTLNKHNNDNFMNNNIGDIKQTVNPNIFPDADHFFNNFIVELKFYKSIDYRPPIKKDLKSFFTKSIEMMKSSNKHIFLLIKENNKEPLIFTTANLNLYLHMSIYFNNITFNCYLYEDFLSTPYQIIMQGVLNYENFQSNNKIN